MKRLTRDECTVRIALLVSELINGLAGKSFILNLGVGIPTAVSSYLNNDRVFIHTENGMLGVGPLARPEEAHPDLINAGRQPVKETPGCSYFDSADSFGIIRGGHVDATVLGAFEVDSSGRVANWMIPGGDQYGVGGAMDLVCGARMIIIAMTHTGKNGPKLVRECSLPLTGQRTVDYVVTEYGVFRYENGRFILQVIAGDICLEDLAGITGLDFEVSENLQVRSFQSDTLAHE